MRNATASEPGTGLDLETLALPQMGGTRRPVKVVQHPAFRSRGHHTATLRQVVPLRVVALNGAGDATDGPSIAAVRGLDVPPDVAAV